MSLPGKLCIGILEEDNPLKSYFRFKPLLVEEDGRYVPCTEAEEYPAEGCIRIVPDKNESYHFKTRMRQMGLFCVVDLRNHPEANDKIRPNKNYHEGSPEQNAFIIYSDVVHEPAPETIFEVLPTVDPDAPLPFPRTAGVLLRDGNSGLAHCEWEADPENEGQAKLMATGKRFEAGSVQTFDLKDFKGEALSFAITAPDGRSFPQEKAAPVEKREPTQEAADEDKAPVTNVAPVANVAPAANVAHVANVAPAANVAHVANVASEASAVPAEKVAPQGKPAPKDRPVKAEPGVRAPEKPWIHHDNSMLPRPVDPRLSPAQRSLAAQSGMNPRRGRSLQELIDEKWQHSRLNQLGQPVAPIQTGAPVASPVDGAVSAVREVWSQPQLRQDLLESLGGIEEFGASLQECREAARQRDIEAHLESLEARRLALLNELDHLTLKHAQTRDALKQELLQDADAELAEAARRTSAAQAERARFETLAEEARAAAQDARKAVDALTGEELERRLREFALSEHMLERLRLIKGEAEAVPPAAPEVQAADLNALAARLMSRYEAEGYSISRMDALNLCACAAVSPVLILSGPVGGGKTEAARLLAEALGWADIGRFARFAPGKGSLEGDEQISDLNALPDTPALLLLDDANLLPSPDALRALGALDRPQWRVCLTVQDGGFPLSAHALDRGFTLRLNPRQNLAWKPRGKAAFAPQPPVSLCLAIPDVALPAAVEDRMERLREMLGRRGAPVSRRALDDMWRYCALMLGALDERADSMKVLDRAVAQRLIPALLASAPLATLRQLPALLEDLPASRGLLRLPLPVMI